MSITFQCEHCHKEIKAPDEAAGKRGKCPFCGQSSYIPAPVSEDDLFDLAPLDEADETRRRHEIEELLKEERAILEGDPADSTPSPDQKDRVTPEHLYHHVVNYCLDMFQGQLERAPTHAAKLKKYGFTAHQAIEDFQTGKALEPALEPIPPRVLQGFLAELKKQMP